MNRLLTNAPSCPKRSDDAQSTLVARLGGHHRPTPFFRDDGMLISVPRVLSVDERAAATP